MLEETSGCFTLAFFDRLNRDRFPRGYINKSRYISCLHVRFSKACLVGEEKKKETGRRKPCRNYVNRKTKYVYACKFTVLALSTWIQSAWSRCGALHIHGTRRKYVFARKRRTKLYLCQHLNTKQSIPRRGWLRNFVVQLLKCLDR